MSLPSEGQSLSANQISSKCLNWWLRYNYFRFWKTNVRHIGNLVSVSISTICPKYAHYSASGYRISSKSKHSLRKYDVISISQDGGRDGWILLPVSYLLMSLPFRRSRSISKPNFVEISQRKWLRTGLPCTQCVQVMCTGSIHKLCVSISPAWRQIRWMSMLHTGQKFATFEQFDAFFGEYMKRTQQICCGRPTWHNLACVHLRRAPSKRNSWYCADCRANEWPS